MKKVIVGVYFVLPWHRERGKATRCNTNKPPLIKMGEPLAEQSELERREARVSRIESLIEEGDKRAFSDPVRLQEIAEAIHRESEEITYQRGLIYGEYFSARVLYKHSEFEQALPRYVSALESFEDIGDEQGIKNGLRQLGLTCQMLCRYDESFEYCHRELIIRKNSSIVDEASTAATLGNIATIHLLTGQQDIALQHYLEALALLENCSNEHLLIGILGNIANLYMSLGEYRQAMVYFQRIIVLCQKGQNKGAEAHTLLNMGWNYLQCGEYEQALKSNEQALKLFEELGDKKRKAIVLLHIGQIYTQLKDYEQALPFFEQSSEMFLDIGDKRNSASVLQAMGDMYGAVKENGRAIEYYKQALDIIKEIGVRQMEYELCEVLAQVTEQQGNTAEALRYYREYMQIKEEVLDERRRQAVSEMQVKFNVEQAEKEKEIYRLKNVELAGALEEVEMLNYHLSEANNEKNELLGIVAHDLKNPIAGLSMSLSLFQNHFVRMSQEEVLRQVGLMTKTVNRMGQIVAKLLDINMLDSGKLTFDPIVLNLNEIIKIVVDDYENRAQEKDITIGCEVGAEELPVYVDRNAMLEVLDNLLSNAIKYSPHHSIVTVRSFSDGEKVQCEVQDSGPGIAPEDFDKLFKKYVRLEAKPTGGETSTGLGLSIVKKLVEAMDGHVQCKSGTKKGACFVIELPRSKI